MKCKKKVLKNIHRDVSRRLFFCQTSVISLNQLLHFNFLNLTMRYLAIDYGLRRVGLACCDAGEIVVSPLCQIDAAPGGGIDELLRRIMQIITDNEIEALVVGLPINMDGAEGEQARICRNFAKKLGAVANLPIHLQDERLSSASADELLAKSEFTSKKKKARRDMLAACEILKDFLL